MLIFFFYHKNKKTKYDKATEWDRSSNHIFHKDDPKAIALMKKAKEDWWLYSNSNTDSKVSIEELELLKTTGFEQSINGIKALQSYEPPEYSYFNISQNQRAAVTSAVKRFTFSALISSHDSNIYYSKDWIYSFPDFNDINDKSFIKAYVKEEDGIHFRLYAKELPEDIKKLEESGITFTRPITHH